MKIKYDRRVMRIILITAVVVSVPTLAGMICGVFFDDIVSTFCDVMMVTSVITFCPMVGLWLACLDVWLYLRELIKAGYEVQMTEGNIIVCWKICRENEKIIASLMEGTGIA